jgi:type 1 fimbria pilin
MDVTIPLQARYVQTDEQITGGELKATAAFVIQYN